MSTSPLRDKSKEFAKQIVIICRNIKADYRESTLTNQLLRSGTSIGANLHEAQYAQGIKDFVSKMEIAQKECFETEYWLELLFETGYMSEEQYKPLKNECGAIRRMLISSLTTVKKKMTASKKLQGEGNVDKKAVDIDEPCVAIGSEVVFWDYGADEEISVRIIPSREDVRYKTMSYRGADYCELVLVSEADGESTLSDRADVVKAMLGKKSGEIVRYKSNDGERCVKILSVKMCAEG